MKSEHPSMKKKSLGLLASLIIVLAGCSTSQRSAPIVDRSPDAKKAPEAAKTVGTKLVDNNGFYTVKKGDTLYHIALEFGQNYRDLVTWNNLANAHDIKIDQVIRVLPPTAVTTEPSGVQTGSVATTSGIEIRPLSSASSVSTAPVASNASALQKNGPIGNKVPYSESALAELQKPDPANFNAVAIPSAVDANAKPSDKTPEKPMDASGLSIEDKNIVWMWPTDGKIVGTFDDGKKGIDIEGKMGQQILAAGTGKVMYAGSGIRGYGNLVIVKHTNNLLSAYAYNKTILVKEGQSVNKGEKIAEMGNSDTDAVKLHFEIRQQGKPVDPTKFLPSR
jgi:lipoprotein NlpD